MKDLYIIACTSKDLGLGYQGNLLWNIKEDMAFFRQTTTNHPVVMGSKTYRSIGRPLPKRQNIVLSHQEDFPQGVLVLHDVAKLDQLLAGTPGPKYIIGGASLYTYYLEQAEKLYLTEVEATKPADTFFPSFDKSKYLRKVLKSGQQDNINYEIVEYAKL